MPIWEFPFFSFHIFFFIFLFQYTFLLVLIFLLEAMVGALAYIYEEQVEAELKLNLNSTFLDHYKIDMDKTRAIDDMQLEVILFIYSEESLIVIYKEYFSFFIE